MPPPAARAADTHLPLTEVVWEILLALSAEERHGYAVLLEVERRTGGALRLLPGSLYRALDRLRRERLIEEAGRDRDDPRRRVYSLTALGRRVVAAEARRLAGKVAAARGLGLLPREEPT
jgi:DNA-binding PadR family transcriptional regulator